MSDPLNEIRNDLSETILGEVRLGAWSDDEILGELKERLEDEEEVTDEIRKSLLAEAAVELASARAEHHGAADTWPTPTDCDRLDSAEARLREAGIVLWQVSPCCDNCTMGEFPDRVEAMEADHPGLSERLRGYAFFIDQNMPEMLAGGTEIHVHMGYGWTLGGEDTAEEDYRREALAIGHEVTQALRDAGLQVDWDGAFSRKLGVRVNWQRSTPLR